MPKMDHPPPHPHEDHVDPDSVNNLVGSNYKVKVTDITHQGHDPWWDRMITRRAYVTGSLVTLNVILPRSNVE